MNTNFEEASIKNVSFKKWLAKVLQPAMVAGCVGTLSSEPEIQELTKNCGIEIIKKVTKTTQLNLTIELHMEKEFAKEMFAFSNNGLVTGVYGFNRDNVSGEYALIAEVNNLDNTDRKFIAFPRVTNISGFVKNIDNGATELAYISLNLTAMYDDFGFAYYEGYESDIEDEEVKSTWLTEWTPELMRAETPEV